jgi:hypothetical protein
VIWCILIVVEAGSCSHVFGVRFSNSRYEPFRWNGNEEIQHVCYQRNVPVGTKHVDVLMSCPIGRFGGRKWNGVAYACFPD